MPLPEPKDDLNHELDERIRPSSEKEDEKRTQDVERDEGVKPLRKEDIIPPDGP